ncbi:MAG TPA: alpha/beta fold hydrolase [Pirellulaceae bacterium]|nr:alpha/beta fold hydrolase [Pirellulaceae bacterium]
MRQFVLITVTFLMTSFRPVLAEPPTATPDDLGVAASQFIDQLVGGEFEKGAEHFDEAMTKAMSPTRLKQTWIGLLLTCGALESRGTTYRAKIAAYDVVYVPCQFKLKSLEIKVVFDQEKAIAGLFFVPPKAEREYKLPSYIDKKAFRESDTSVGNDPWKLPGTLAIPNGKGPFPAVVLVHGSGPNDRDETVGANKPFKDLGMGLATNGVVTLRYDKRTKVHGVKMVLSKDPLTVKQETVDDVIEAVRLLKENAIVDAKRIFVLGHSLGGYLVPRIAARDAESLVAGYVVLAGSTRPTEELMWEQTNYLLKLDGTLSDADQERLDTLRQQIDKIKSAGLADESPTTSILGATSPYWLDLRGYEPAKQAAKVNRPMIILQGERDYQVTMVDFQNWKDALSSRDDVQFQSYPNLNHLFISGHGKSTPSEYALRGNVSKLVVDDILKWITQR